MPIRTDVLIGGRVPFFTLSKLMTNRLYSFLNKEYMKRSQKHGRGYTIVMFAKEVGLEYGTMRRLLDPNEKVKGLEFETLQVLAACFGKEFLIDMGLWPEGK